MATAQMPKHKQLEMQGLTHSNGQRKQCRVTVNFDLAKTQQCRYTFSKIPTVLDIVNLVRNSPNLGSSDGKDLRLVCGGHALKSTDKIPHGSNVYIGANTEVSQFERLSRTRTPSTTNITSAMSAIFKRRKSKGYT